MLIQSEQKYWKDKSEKYGLSIEEIKAMTNGSLLIWSETHRVIMGKPFSLVNYPFMEDIYMDWSKEMCIIKSAQCFVDYTLIQTDKGQKKIKDIKIGDIVLTHMNRYKKVIHIKKEQSNNLVSITGKNFKRVVCTRDHKFLINDEEWKEANIINKNDYLNIYDGEIRKIKMNRRIVFYGKRDVYDLTVEDDHSYIANGYIVHNCGASEYFTNMMLFVADTNRGHTYLVFPTMKDVGIFVQGRIDTAADESPYIQLRLKGKTDNTSIKRFGLRNMYFTGAQKRIQIISSPADIVLQDEYDEHNPDTDTTIQKRMNNSSLKMMRKISTPTISGMGISAEYDKSSKAVWIHNCKICKKDIRISGLDIGDKWKSMIKTIGKDDKGEKLYIYCCPYCQNEIFPSIGRWEHTVISDYHGYSVNRMMTKSCTANELMKAFDLAEQHDNMKEFFNSDLGVPYETKGSRVYKSNCKACEKQYKSINIGKKGIDYLGGMDIGKKKHIVMLHEEQGSPIVDMCTTIDDFDEAERIISDFDAKMFVCDYRPEPTKVSELYDKNKIVRGAEHNTGIVKPTSLHGKEEHVIGYNRFFSIERIYNNILSKKIIFPKDINEISDKWFYKHICSQVRIERVTDSGQKQRNYKPTNGKKKIADHFLFALIYALAARDVYNETINKHAESGFIIL